MDSRDLEARLPEALRPVEPPPGFAARVLRRLDEGRGRKLAMRKWTAMAAMVCLLAAGGWYWRQHRAASRAADQLSLALNISARKLSRVQQGLVVEIKLGRNTNQEDQIR
jgi:hypothetical protein